jgi:hypothetical protein
MSSVFLPTLITFFATLACTFSSPARANTADPDSILQLKISESTQYETPIVIQTCLILKTGFSLVQTQIGNQDPKLKMTEQDVDFVSELFTEAQTLSEYPLKAYSPASIAAGDHELILSQSGQPDVVLRKAGKTRLRNRTGSKFTRKIARTCGLLKNLRIQKLDRWLDQSSGIPN